MQSSLVLLTLVAAACCVAMTAAADEPLTEDTYASSMATSMQRERRGDLAGAARVLANIVDSFPQDLTLVLRLGYLANRLLKPELARSYYRQALELSPRSDDAHAGLGWSFALSGDCNRARKELAAVSTNAPARTDAKAAVAHCEAEAPSLTVSLGLTGQATTFANHPVRTWSAGVSARGDVWSSGGLTFGLGGRYVEHQARSGSTLGVWEQHEVYARAGYGTPRVGLTAHYGYLDDASGTQGASHHFGVVGRWSPAGDIYVQATVSSYRDMTIVRVAPSWKFVLGGGFYLTPGVSIQSTGSNVETAASLTAAYDSGRLSIYLGGKSGWETRPSYLAIQSIENLPETVAWSAWSGLRVRPSEHLLLHATYGVDELRNKLGATSYAHTFSFGIGTTF